MISRIVSTAVLALLSASAFLAQTTFAQESDSTVFPAFGVVCLLLAGLNWFAWAAIREGWDYGRRPGEGGPVLPVSASFWPVYIAGFLNALSAAGRHPSRSGAPRGGDRRS